MNMTDCCALGLTRSHRHLRTVCPACDALVFEVLLAGDEKPPPAIQDRAMRVVALHQRTCRKRKP
jgi:hypothetical protein